MRVGGQRHAPALLSPRKTRYPLYRNLGGPHSRCAEYLTHTGIRSPDRPARSESLYRLRYRGSRHRRHEGKMQCDIKDIFRRVNENEQIRQCF